MILFISDSKNKFKLENKMKIIDTFMYFNEDLILDIRLNELNNFVDKFVIVESLYTHSGEKKGLNFDINKFKKFSDKIIYITSNDIPSNYQEVNLTDSEDKKREKKLYEINNLNLFYLTKQTVDKK